MSLRSWLSIPFLCVACGDDPTTAAAIDAPRELLRFVELGPDAAQLETATVRYRAPNGADVDLIGVVHIADAAYYAELDRSFADYDAVLYEMIKPEGAAPTGIRDAKSPVSMIQQLMCRSLELEFQLESIDYGRPNFVHADLTTEEFGRLWEERDESVLKLFLRILASQHGNTTSITPTALFAAARSKQRSARLKLLIGKDFSKLEKSMSGLGSIGEDGRDRSMLLGMRNAAAVETVASRLARGDRRIALVYGAAHGPDLDLRMTEDLKLTRTAITWRTAWQIDARGR